MLSSSNIYGFASPFRFLEPHIPPKSYGTTVMPYKNAWRKKTRRYRANNMKGGEK